jgi:subfamily B ATP-binding cassette protein MsbA
VSRGEPRLRPFALLFWAFAPSPAELATLILTLLGVWLCELATPFLLGRTVDAAVSMRHAAGAIFTYGAITFAVTLCLYFVHAAYLRHEARIVSSAAFDLRRHIYTRLLDQPLEWFGAVRSGEIAQRVIIDSEIIDEDAIQLCADVPFALLTVLGVFTVMLWTQASLAMLVLATLGAAAALSHRVGRPLGDMEAARKKRRVTLGGALHSVLDSIRVMRIFGRRNFEAHRLDVANDALAKAEVAAGTIFARLEPLLELIRACGFLAIVWYGAWLVFAGALTPGKLVAFIAYMELLSEPMQSAGRYYRHYAQTNSTLGRICDLLAGLSWPQRQGTGIVAGPLCIELRDVAYAYPGAECAALAGISLAARPGEIVAIAGRNGAGKSTLADILLGLRQPDSGTVSIGGLLIEDWDPRALRDAMAAVAQDTELFDGTLEDNIMYGAPAAGADEVGAAAEAAGLEHLIARLPQGLQTNTGDTALSGGERQLVALARALIRNPRVLILDEPGAGLDARALVHLGHVLRDSSHDRVTIIVAHDAALLSLADRVVFLSDGKMVAPLHACGAEQDALPGAVHA